MKIDPFTGGVYGLNLRLCQISPETGDPGKRFKDLAACPDASAPQIAKGRGQFIINRNRRLLAVLRGRGPDVGGKIVVSACYSGRYRLAGEFQDTTVRLGVSDKQAAESKLRKLVQELEREGEGLISAKKLRNGLQMPFSGLVEDYVAELNRLGRNEKYVKGVRKQLEALAAGCSWRTVRNVNADSFLKWRQTQTLIAKTLNEYLICISALMNWAERFERVASNPLRHVTRIECSAYPTFKRRALTDEEARRLLAVSGARATVYLTAIKTGLRRGELEKLEWRDVHFDGEPFLNPPLLFEHKTLHDLRLSRLSLSLR